MQNHYIRQYLRHEFPFMDLIVDGQAHRNMQRIDTVRHFKERVTPPLSLTVQSSLHDL